MERTSQCVQQPGVQTGQLVADRHSLAGAGRHSLRRGHQHRTPSCPKVSLPTEDHMLLSPVGHGQVVGAKGTQPGGPHDGPSCTLWLPLWDPSDPQPSRCPPHFASCDNPVPCAALDTLYLVFSSAPTAGAVMNSVL